MKELLWHKNMYVQYAGIFMTPLLEMKMVVLLRAQHLKIFLMTGNVRTVVFQKKILNLWKMTNIVC